MADVTQDGWWVRLAAGQGYEEIEPDTLTPDEADAVALQLTRAAAAAKEKKPRSGILGIHPIAILVGLAALHYFLTRSTGD